MTSSPRALLISLTSSFLLLHGCGGGGSTTSSPTLTAPTEVNVANAAIASSILAANGYALTPLAPDTQCEVRVLKMTYDTIGGAGEATSSGGVMMVPQGDGPNCSGPRPVMLYAHGTSTDKDYDLSQFITNPANPAASEAGIIYAAYALRGYVVVAPNYAGYADSSLSYHPYLDRTQQPTEMMDALDYAKAFSADVGVELSGDIYLSGLSQGGYVAMATHKALEARGDVVKASLPISGPYAVLGFMDQVIGGAVNIGATSFAPLLLSALDQSVGIYDDPTEVYSSKYAATADNVFPKSGGFTAAMLAGEVPGAALYSRASGDATLMAQYAWGYSADAADEEYLLADEFKANYFSNNSIRQAAADLDLSTDTWAPQAPIAMCGSASDPVVYHATNSDAMAAQLQGNLGAAGALMVQNIDLDAASPDWVSLVLTPTNTLATQLMAAGQAAEAVELLGSIHGYTGVFCTLAGLPFFEQLGAH